MSSEETSSFSDSYKSSSNITNEPTYSKENNTYYFAISLAICFLSTICLIIGIIFGLVLIFHFSTEKSTKYDIIMYDDSTNMTIYKSIDPSEIQKFGFQNLGGNIIILSPELLSGEEEEYEVEGDCYCCNYENKRQIAETCLLYGAISVVIMAYSITSAQQKALSYLESKCNEKSCDFASQAHIEKVRAKYYNKLWWCEGFCVDYVNAENVCNEESYNMVIGPETTRDSAMNKFFYDFLNPHCMKTFDNCKGFELKVTCVREF